MSADDLSSSRQSHQSNDSDWRVVLEKHDTQQVVLYNEKMHQLALHRMSQGTALTTETTAPPNYCRLCKRPFAGFEPYEAIDGDYFKVLGDILRRNGEPPSREEDWCAKNLPETAFNQGYYARFFKEGRKLGRGSGGAVFLCQHLIDGVPLGEYAIKIVPIGDDRDWLLRHLKEVHVLERLRHPNIIEYKHTWIEYHKLSKFAPTVPCLFILMEFANGGNLEDFINLEVSEVEPRRKKKGKPEIEYMDEGTILRLFLASAKGLAHLHSLGILHRDLKPGNLLLNYPRESVSEPTALLSDFGECAELGKDGQPANRTGATGTIEFVAPELFKLDAEGEYIHSHSTRTDIWSLGMILYYLYFARLPYIDVERVDVLKETMSSLVEIPIPLDVRPMSRSIHALLQAMLDLDWNRRPDLQHVIKTVEAFFMTKGSPIMHSFPSSNVLALPFKEKPVPFQIGKAALQLGRYLPSLLLLPIYYRCYPCLPALLILVMSAVSIIPWRAELRPAHIGAWITFIFAVLFYSLNKRLCAC